MKASLSRPWLLGWGRQLQASGSRSAVPGLSTCTRLRGGGPYVVGFPSVLGQTIICAPMLEANKGEACWAGRALRCAWARALLLLAASSWRTRR